MAEEIERLIVVVESDLAGLITEVDKGVDKAESRLKKFAKTGKRAFNVIKVAATASLAAVVALGVAINGLIQAAERGLAGVRIRRAFKSLAASFGQSSDDIIRAMQEASDFTVNRMELMRQANVALQLGVAKTPEEFAKLTRSAITLGRAVGAGPTESINLLINAAGRRSTEVLDNLGISLAEVNTKMEEFAQIQFGRTTKQLSTVQNNALFMQAALEVAADKADILSDNLQDVGSSMEQAKVRTEEFKQSFDEASLVVVGKVSEIGQAMTTAFFGPNGMFPLFEEGGNLVAEVFVFILASFLAVAGSMAQAVGDIRKVFEGELSIFALQDTVLGAGAADRFLDNYSKALKKIKTDFSEVFGEQFSTFGPIPGDPIPGDQDRTPVKVPEEEIGEEAADKFVELGKEFLDIQDETNAELQANEIEHNERIQEIQDDAASNAIKAMQDAADEQIALDKEIVDSRADIFAQTREDLAGLEQDTDQALERERGNFQTNELRSTEDHLRDMRRLRLSFIDNLEDAAQV